MTPTLFWIAVGFIIVWGICAMSPLPKERKENPMTLIRRIADAVCGLIVSAAAWIVLSAMVSEGVEKRRRRESK